MSGFGIVPTNAEMTDRVVVALPEEWSAILRNMRNQQDFSGLTLSAFEAKLKLEEYHEKRRINHQRNSQYGSFSSSSLNDSAGAPLRTSGFGANVASSSPQLVPTQYVQTANGASGGSGNANVSTGTAPSQNVSANASQVIQLDLSGLKVDNICKSSVQDLQQKFELFKSFINSYNDMLEGTLGNPNLTAEDYGQLDDDELERQDIAWGMANMARREKNFRRRTGIQVRPDRNQRFGFDPKKVKCFRCGGNHFVRNCPVPASTVRVTEMPPESTQAVVNYSSNSSSAAFKAIYDDEGFPNELN